MFLKYRKISVIYFTFFLNRRARFSTIDSHSFTFFFALIFSWSNLIFSNSSFVSSSSVLDPELLDELCRCFFLCFDFFSFLPIFDFFSSFFNKTEQKGKLSQRLFNFSFLLKKRLEVTSLQKREN